MPTPPTPTPPTSTTPTPPTPPQMPTPTSPATARRPARSTKLLIAAAAASAAALLVGPRLFGARPDAPAPAGHHVVVPAGGACAAGSAPARGNAGFARGTMTAALSGSTLPAAGGEVYVSIDVTAAAATGDRPAVDLALVIDRSGSMAGDKLVSAKRAAEGILGRLGDQDRVALVQYDNSAELLVPLTALDGAGRGRLRAAIGGIVERGGTNLHGGMLLGQQELLRGTRPGRVNRVVLLSDGQANEGITDAPTLGRIAAGVADKGVRLTTVGMGLDYNEDLMELLAENGRGRYYYVKDAASLESVFAGELASMQATVASATELRLSPACAGVEVLEVYGYEVRRQGAAAVVPMVDLFGGDSRRLVARLRVPAGAGDGAHADLLGVELRYTDARSKQPGSAALALGAAFTSDRAAVAAAVDREVMTHVVQMEAATAMRGAATAYERGDQQGARALLIRKQAEMNSLASQYKLAPAKVQQAMREMPAFADEIQANAPASASGKDSLKRRKSEAKMQMKAKW